MERHMRSSRGVSQGQGRRRAAQSSTCLPGTGRSSNAGLGRQGSNLSINHCDRYMENIASVSRSSGLAKDGDLLKEKSVQEEFRAFINKKLRAFWDLHGVPAYSLTTAGKPESESALKRKKDEEQNILILFRKLREGLFASGRKDEFTLEVYEMSLYLSVVFDSPVQTTSILSRLVPDIYSAAPTPQPFRLTTVLVLLLHQLILSFPSQRAYLEQIRHLVPNLLERPSAAYAWVSTLARSLRMLNFVQFERLTHPDAFEHLLPLSSHPVSSDATAKTVMLQDIPRRAILALVSQLRLKARDGAWTVVRNVYRELSSSDETQTWLGRRLFFDSFGSEASVVRFDDWVQKKCQDGQLRHKEGAEGRWVVCKTK